MHVPPAPFRSPSRLPSSLLLLLRLPFPFPFRFPLPLALALLLCSAAGARPAPALAAGEGAGTCKVVKAYPAMKDGTSQFVFSVCPCEGDACALEVSLVANDRRLDGRFTGWPAPKDIFRPLGEGFWIGEQDGDGGQDLHGVQVDPRLVRIDAKRNGLLLTETVGFEVIRRQHVLFVPVGNKLAVPFEVKDPESGAPIWHTVEVEDTDRDGRDELLHWEHDQTPLGSGQPERVVLEVLRWDTARRKISKLAPAAAKVPATAVIVGSFDTFEAAAKAKDALPPECPKGGLYLLRTDSFPNLKRGLLILASVHRDLAKANEAIATWKNCGVASYSKPLFARSK